MNQLARNERIAIYASNVANLVLFLAKVYASFESRSLAVIASTLDSLLDLLSGFILWFTSNAMRKPNQYRYPIGKNRMQPVVSISNNLRRHKTKICTQEKISSLLNQYLSRSNISIWEHETKFVKKLVPKFAGNFCIVREHFTCNFLHDSYTKSQTHCRELLFLHQ